MAKRLFCAILVVCVLSGCATAPAKKASTNAPPRNPCYDPVFVELAQKPIDQLTEREYQIYLEKEKACAAYRQADMQAQPRRDLNTILGLFLGAVVAVSAIGLMIANGE